MTKEVVQKESVTGSKDVYLHHTLPTDGTSFSYHTLTYAESKGTLNVIRFWYGIDDDQIVKVTF